MSSRLTVAEALPTLARVLQGGMVLSDPRLIDYLNEATQRLMSSGIWVGMVAEILVCAKQKCFTLPREIETALEIFIPDRTMDVQSGWYAFENASTYLDTTNLHGPQLIDRGEVPTAFDVCGTVRLKVYSDTEEETGTVLRIFGYIDPAQHVHQGSGPTYQPYEEVPLNPAGVVTSTPYVKVTSFQKSYTHGPVRVYAMTTNADGTPNEALIASFEADERIPCYRRYYCPEIPVPLDTSVAFTVRVSGKRRFIPVKRNTDFLILGNLAALKLECMSIEREESGDVQSAQVFHENALKLLESEVKNHVLDPSRAAQRKAQMEEDLASYDPRQLGFVRAKMGLELPHFANVSQRTLGRSISNAQSRLINMGHWKDSVVWMNLQVFGDGYVVLPPFAASILGGFYGGRELSMRDRFWEFNDAGAGLAAQMKGPLGNLVDKGTGCTFVDLINPSSIAVTCVKIESDDFSVELNGLDDAGLPVVEVVGANSGSATQFSLLNNVTKTISNGPVNLSSVDWPVLAVLQPNDRSPLFRRYYVGGTGSNLDPGQTILAQVQLGASGLHHPHDYLSITNYQALKSMTQAVLHYDLGDMEKGAPYEAQARIILGEELTTHRGPATQTLSLQRRAYSVARMRQPH